MPRILIAFTGNTPGQEFLSSLPADELWPPTGAHGIACELSLKRCRHVIDREMLGRRASGDVPRRLACRQVVHVDEWLMSICLISMPDEQMPRLPTPNRGCLLLTLGTPLAELNTSGELPSLHS
jgi:hypothetical protein